MSGIYGSSCKKKFIELEKLNKKNKKMNYSTLMLNREFFDVSKIHALAEGYKLPRKRYELYMGIVYPKTKLFDGDIMEPFMWDTWILASFGDFYDEDGNKETLNESFFSEEILEMIFDNIEMGETNDVKILTNSVSCLGAKFSLWAYNIVTGNTFLVKCGTDIYADIYTNTFSSVRFKDSEELRDGEIYQLTREGITPVGVFDCTII
jgi:hypothetical protein